MWGPLAILAALSLGGGFINIPKFLEPMFPWSPKAYSAYVVVYGLDRLRPRRHRARLSLLRGRARPSRIDRQRPSARSTLCSTTNISSTKPTIRPSSARSSTARARCSGAPSTPESIDGTVNGVGKTARTIGGVFAAAIRIHPELRRMGGRRSHPGRHRRWASREVTR